MVRQTAANQFVASQHQHPAARQLQHPFAAHQLQLLAASQLRFAAIQHHVAKRVASCLAVSASGELATHVAQLQHQLAATRAKPSDCIASLLASCVVNMRRDLSILSHGVSKT